MVQLEILLKRKPLAWRRSPLHDTDGHTLAFGNSGSHPGLRL
jgi:hypothetical protein